MKRRARAASSASPRPVAALRTLAAALVAVLLLAQGASALHELLVPHYVCAEHGHRVHGSAALIRAFDASGASAVPAATPRGVADSEAHDHCALPARPEQTGLRVERAALGELAIVGDFSAPPPADELVRAGPPILLLAPKQSPPRV